MSTRIIFAAVNIIGGAAVLGSYAWCITVYPEHRAVLWGGVQGALRSMFTLSMFLAAAGYLTFCYVYIFEGGAMTLGNFSVIRANTIVILAIVFLTSAAIWMPSLITYIRTGKSAWWTICVVSLWVTALALLVMMLVTAVSPSDGLSELSKYVSVTGLAYITFHCLILDAIVWVVLYARWHRLAN